MIPGLLIAAAAAALKFHLAQSWSYSDQINWPGQCQQSAGALSPINIDKVQVDYDSSLGRSFRCDYITTPDAVLHGTVLHDDNSLQVLIDQTRSNYTCTGVPFESGTGADQYRLASLELHWSQADSSHGSEHSIGGEFSTAELQMVHFNSLHANFTNALTKADGLLVVSIMFFHAQKYDQSDNVVGNDALFEIASKSNASLVSVPAADLLLRTGLDPSRPHRFYTYKGSLTHPPCTQGVTWVFAEGKAFIELPTLNLLRGLIGGDGQPIGSNIRDQQPIAGRTVFASWDRTKQADEHGQLLMLIVSLVGASIVLIATGVLAWMKFRTNHGYKEFDDAHYNI